MFCVPRCDDLCLYHPGREWCYNCGVCWSCRLLPDPQCLPLPRLLCRGYLPSGVRICRWVPLRWRTDVRCSFRDYHHQHRGLKETVTLPNLPFNLWGPSDIFFLRHSIDKIGPKETEVRIIAKVIDWSDSIIIKRDQQQSIGQFDHSPLIIKGNHT